MHKTFTTLLLSAATLFSLPGYGQIEEPSLPEPIVWLRADRGAVTSTLWTDESGNSNNATTTEEGATRV